jgi:hypothetical protein
VCVRCSEQAESPEEARQRILQQDRQAREELQAVARQQTLRQSQQLERSLQVCRACCPRARPRPTRWHARQAWVQTAD